MSSQISLFFSLGLLGLTTACGHPVAPQSDAGKDASVTPLSDAGNGNQETPDSSVNNTDSGPGTSDAAPSDAAPSDAAPSDAAPSDAAPPHVVTAKSCLEVYNQSTPKPNQDNFFEILDEKNQTVRVWCQMKPLQTADHANKPGWTVILVTGAAVLDSSDATKSKPEDNGILALKEGVPSPTQPGYLKHAWVKALLDSNREVQIKIESVGNAYNYVASNSSKNETANSPVANLKAGNRLDVGLKKDEGDGFWFGPTDASPQQMKMGENSASDNHNFLGKYPHIYRSRNPGTGKKHTSGGLYLHNQWSGWGQQTEWGMDNKEMARNVSLMVSVR